MSEQKMVMVRVEDLRNVIDNGGVTFKNAEKVAASYKSLRAALSAPAPEARTEYEWTTRGERFQVSWEPRYGWCLFRSDRDGRWCLGSVMATDAAAAEIAKLKGLVPPGGEE